MVGELISAWIVEFVLGDGQVPLPSVRLLLISQDLLDLESLSSISGELLLVKVDRLNESNLLPFISILHPINLICEHSSLGDSDWLALLLDLESEWLWRPVRSLYDGADTSSEFDSLLERDRNRIDMCIDWILLILGCYSSNRSSSDRQSFQISTWAH